MPIIQMGNEFLYTVTIFDALISPDKRRIDTILALKVFDHSAGTEEVITERDDIDYILGWMDWDESDEMGCLYLSTKRGVTRGC